MKCKDAMTVGLRVLPLSATARDAAATMRDNSLGFLPVCDPDGRLVGVITDRDISVRVATRDRLPGAVSVIEVMSAPPLVCLGNDPIEVAERLMVAEGVSRLVVVDREGCQYRATMPKNIPFSVNDPVSVSTR